MRLPPRRVLTPTKRKERDDYKPPTTKSLKPTPAEPESYKAPDPVTSSNQLLAGYLAHEYLTKGTLFGKPFEAAGEQAGSGQGFGSSISCGADEVKLGIKIFSWRRKEDVGLGGGSKAVETVKGDS
ncbi:hypothetical protein Patl1_01734 [Pistacia atlantica]|uniref:Uncharacterized protein n=1 Tax=Pistacia atlantica TaxID=434234 RepID=A0ACC1CCB6_9ROSI|nr:hypothetical protein Patl1_01734 [Pistacia atlantica]